MRGDGTGPAWYFAFHGRDLLVHEREDAVGLPDARAWAALALRGVAEHHAGELGGVRCVAVELPPDTEPPPGTAFHGLRGLFGRLEAEAFRLAGRAVQLVEWDRTHRFCGACAAPTERVPGEPARRCAACGLLQYPRISPAVIVRIDRGERTLLARGPGFAPGRYSTLAGFVEAGESLEEAVAREVREEVGIEVRDVRYFGSQPWPFPHSLMVGFTATYAGGEIRPQPGEIEDARWFGPDDLPGLPTPISIARALVDAWLAERGGRTDAERR